MSSPSAGASPARNSQFAYNLFAIALGAALAAIGLAYGIDALSRTRAMPAAESTSVTRTLGSRDLAIPQAWLAAGDTRAEAFVTQVKLHVPLTLSEKGKPTTIDVTLMPQSQVRPSAALLDAVYLHLFSDEERDGPVGLIGKPLSSAEGYAGETVWYDPLSAQPFVAKCLDALTPVQPATCLRTVVVAKGLAAIYSFDATVLEHWRQFDPLMREKLAGIGALTQ